MRSLQLRSNSTFVPLSTTLAAKNSSTSHQVSLQARANLSKVDDLSAVSSILKAQYKRLQASKLQAQNPELEEEKQGKSGFGRSQASKQQAKNSKLQGKGDWQQKANFSAIFGGNGGSLSNGLMAKYEKLMPGINLGHVKVFQGASVDKALHQAGLQGLTDGTRVAVSSKAQAGTLEHELGHVAQRQVQGFNLTEGTRQGYEQQADSIAAKLLGNQTVSEVQGATVQGSRQKMQSSMQAECKACEEKAAMSKTIPGQDYLSREFQAFQVADTMASFQTVLPQSYMSREYQASTPQYQANPLSGFLRYLSRFPACIGSGDVPALIGSVGTAALKCPAAVAEYTAAFASASAAPATGGLSAVLSAVLATIGTADGAVCLFALASLLGSLLKVHNCMMRDPGAEEAEKAAAAAKAAQLEADIAQMRQELQAQRQQNQQELARLRQQGAQDQARIRQLETKIRNLEGALQRLGR